MLIRRSSRASLATASLCLVVLALGGCDSEPDTTSSPAKGPAVIVPGEPGGANRTMSAEDAERQRADDDSPNSADKAYVRMMIEHHSQALLMTGLVPDRAGSAQVGRLAERIAAAQGPELAALRSWQKTHGGEEAAGGHDHDHAAMPGMATREQLDQLRAARGEAFDELFLKLMITHHQGAVTMATDVKAHGNNVQVEEMADDVVAQQTSEITRMRDML
ncbi:DUF305 domain-containing protein [Streptomyces sp. NPDC046831]|uniref:DUF305 domain-containing protein n=1 Tax=Streptomyces sp. NPDC046831 TaxID=3154805 RepID=UPI003402A620